MLYGMCSVIGMQFKLTARRGGNIDFSIKYENDIATMDKSSYNVLYIYSVICISYLEVVMESFQTNVYVKKMYIYLKL